MNAVLGWVTVKPVLTVGVVVVLAAASLAACYMPWWSFMAVGVLTLTVLLMAAGLLL